MSDKPVEKPVAATPTPAAPVTPVTPVATPESDVLDRALSMSEDQVLPWEDIVLPSEGYYYDGVVPGGKIQVRPMGLFADKILATQRLAQTGKSLDWLFRKCTKFPDNKFDPINLLAGDRTFLLYYLRGITHGNIYEYIVKCSNENCGQSTTSEYDLNDLSKTIIRPKYALGEEPFKVVLPHMSKIMKTDFWVKLRLLRGYDMQAMLTGRKVFKKIQTVGKTLDKGPSAMPDSIDETIEDNLNMLIVEAMGSKDRMKIKNLVGKLHASDTATIRDFLKDNSPGIDTTISVTCPGCDQEMRMELPITESFFRPTAARRDRE